MAIDDFKTKTLKNLKEEKYQIFLEQFNTDYVDVFYYACREIFEMLKDAEILFIENEAKTFYKNENLLRIGTEAYKISSDKNLNVDLVLDFLKDAFVYSIDISEKNSLSGNAQTYNNGVITNSRFENKIYNCISDWDSIKNEIKSKIQK